MFEDIVDLNCVRKGALLERSTELIKIAYPEDREGRQYSGIIAKPIPESTSFIVELNEFI